MRPAQKIELSTFLQEVLSINVGLLHWRHGPMASGQDGANAILAKKLAVRLLPCCQEPTAQG